MDELEIVVPYSNPSGLSCVLTPTIVTIDSTVIATGPRGEKGEIGDLNYTHMQMSPANEWLCAHNLGKFTSVTVVDSSGSTVEGDVTLVDNDTVIIRFNSPFSGKAFFN